MSSRLYTDIVADLLFWFLGTSEAHVPANTLDTIAGKDRLLNARIIKIDVEGAEASVIKGINALLPQFSDKTEWAFEVTSSGINS